MDNLNNEEIEQFIHDCQINGSHKLANTLFELLAYREAQGNVVAVTGEDEISNMQATGLYLRAWPTDRQRNEVEGYTIPLYAAPQLPAVPDEHAEFESFMSERFGDLINIRRAKNGDNEYMAWDVAVAWIAWKQRAILKSASFRETDNSSTKHFRESAETSTNCPKCGGRGSYHCPQANGSVDCECVLAATPKPPATENK